MDFNPAPASVMHVDINSCFATIEQQANPAFRGKPLVVAAYAEDHGCVLTASTEAKRLGIQTGMRVREARAIFRNLIVLPPDPDKYRFVNRKLKGVLESYTPYVSVESIDEMVLNLANTPALGIALSGQARIERMTAIGREIKQRIKNEIGEWITVSVGIAPNRYLAKVASGLHKPDGLDCITHDTIGPILAALKLEDLCGIKSGNANRLRSVGITTPVQMYGASDQLLARAFRSVVGYHWWHRLHGYEDGSLYKAFGSPDGEQKSFGQSHALGKPFLPTDPHLWQVLAQLVVKMGSRLRSDGFTARGVGVYCMMSFTEHWGEREMLKAPIYADGDFYRRCHALLIRAPARPVKNLAVYCHEIHRDLYAQQSLLETEQKKERVTKAVDAISARWGSFVIAPARMMALEKDGSRQSGGIHRGAHKVMDRISFGRVRELQKAP